MRLVLLKLLLQVLGSLVLPRIRLWLRQTFGRSWTRLRVRLWSLRLNPNPSRQRFPRYRVRRTGRQMSGTKRGRDPLDPQSSSPELSRSRSRRRPRAPQVEKRQNRNTGSEQDGRSDGQRKSRTPDQSPLRFPSRRPGRSP